MWSSLICGAAPDFSCCCCALICQLALASAFSSSSNRGLCRCTSGNTTWPRSNFTRSMRNASSSIVCFLGAQPYSALPSTMPCTRTSGCNERSTSKSPLMTKLRPVALLTRCSIGPLSQFQSKNTTTSTTTPISTASAVIIRLPVLVMTPVHFSPCYYSKKLLRRKTRVVVATLGKRGRRADNGGGGARYRATLDSTPFHISRHEANAAGHRQCLSRGRRPARLRRRARLSRRRGLRISLPAELLFDGRAAHRVSRTRDAHRAAGGCAQGVQRRCRRLPHRDRDLTNIGKAREHRRAVEPGRAGKDTAHRAHLRRPRIQETIGVSARRRALHPLEG